jgi:hypothetical protein
MATQLVYIPKQRQDIQVQQQPQHATEAQRQRMVQKETAKTSDPEFSRNSR